MAFLYLLAEKFSCQAMFSKTKFAIVSHLRFISRTNFILSGVKHEKMLYNLGARFHMLATKIQINLCIHVASSGPSSPSPEVIKLFFVCLLFLLLFFCFVFFVVVFSFSTQLSMKFSLLRNMEMPTIVGIFIFLRRENFMLSFV